VEPCTEQTISSLEQNTRIPFGAAIHVTDYRNALSCGTPRNGAGQAAVLGSSLAEEMFRCNSWEA